MHVPANPFFTKINIPDEYFCDRKRETEKLIDLLINDNNIVLKSPRRLGKSSLLMHVLAQPSIRDRYNTLFVDIYGTRNMMEFVKEFQSAFLEAPFALTKRGAEKVKKLLMGAYLQMNLMPDGTIGGFRVGLNPNQDMAIPLKEMFGFMENTDKPNLVIFDEFQTILDYPEKASALVRTLTQKLGNTSFIFSGSATHLLDKMFEYPNEPFYRSAASFNLESIPMESYRDFAEEMFLKYGKHIDSEAVDLVYFLFSGVTYDMQEVMKGTFSFTEKGKKADTRTVMESINDILDRRDTDFRGILARMDNMKERNTLFCVAREGIARGMTSSAMMSRYHLDNASSVQHALATLCGEQKNLIRRMGKAYLIRDRMFELWMARSEKRLAGMVEHARERYLEEMELMP